jgi:hypothetical protein
MTQTVGNARSATLADGLTHLTSATTRIFASFSRGDQSPPRHVDS